MQVQADPWKVITRYDSTQFDRWKKGQTRKDIKLANGVPFYLSNFKVKKTVHRNMNLMERQQKNKAKPTLLLPIATLQTLWQTKMGCNADVRQT